MKATPRTRRAMLDLAVRPAREYAEVDRGDDDAERRHTFTVTVESRGFGADWSDTCRPQEIRAHSLVEALVLAIGVPFPQWFYDDDELKELEP